MAGVVQVSVIVPAYNEELFVGRCLRSLLKQSLAHTEYEIIVVDDGSTDGTVAALSVFSDSIRLIRNKTNQGLPQSLNTGILSARGQFIVRVDADDYVHYEYLKILMMHLQLNHEIDAVACDYLLVNERQDVIRHVDCSAEPIGCGIMFRLSQLIDVGLYDPDFLRCEEEELRKRFERKYSIDKVRLPLYRYRMHEDNMSRDEALMKFYRSKL